MFGWRKRNSSGGENLCPYCNSPNSHEAEQCSLCYYELNSSAREQPMAPPSSSDSEIMLALLNDDFEEFEEEEAVEAVLLLGEITVEIDQFKVSDEDEEDDFQFIESKGPTLSEIKDYQKPEEVQLSKSDVPTKEVDFIVPTINPLEEVAEPVHTGQGSLFSVSSENDFDVEEIEKSSVPIPGRTNMDPQIISEELDDTKVDLATAIIEDDVKLSTPELPEIPEIPEVIKKEIASEILDTSGITEIIETPEIPEILEQKDQSKNTSDQSSKVSQKPAPLPQHNSRIWPWPAKQAWDERQVYREVVTMLELVKSGKLVQTAEMLDKLGPHLSNNIDMLTHIGTIMRYLSREEHLQWMLKMAQTVYPNDERVSSAITHLSN